MTCRGACARRGKRERSCARRFFLTALLTGAGIATPAFAQIEASRPEIDALFAAWDRGDAPGCALGVVEAGELVYERGYGSANLDWQIPIDTETVFYVGSVSKQFTAAAVALLSLDGLIDLDDDIRDYFPEMPTYERPITVRHLVHHTSGLRDIYTLMALAGIRLEDVFSDEDAIALIAAQQATNFPPGDQYLYSNSGYFLLAQLVERVTGQPLREYAQEKIFAPLGMRDTHFHDRPDHIVERRAMSYQPDSADGFRLSYLGNFDKVGAGGLYSTIRDLLLWDRNFYTGDVGGAAFLELIHTTGTLADGEPITYAFGLTVDEYRGARTVSHSGSMMGFKAAFLQIPELRFTVLAACNLGPIVPMDLAHDVADIWLGDALVAVVEDAQGRDEDPSAPAAEEPFDAGERAAFAGHFYSSELDATYRLFVEGDDLWLQVGAMSPRRVRKVGDGEARAGNWRLALERDADGTVRGFTVDAGRVTGIRFARR